MRWQALEEITVTAQRVSERLQDVPVAVTAILADELDKRGVRQAGDITSSIPSGSRRPPTASPTPGYRSRAQGGAASEWPRGSRV
jgi:iron complex outermembrane receptor protein